MRGLYYYTPPTRRVKQKRMIPAAKLRFHEACPKTGLNEALSYATIHARYDIRGAETAD